MNMHIVKGLIEQSRCQSTNNSHDQHYAGNPSTLHIKSLLLAPNCSITHTITNSTSQTNHE